MSWLSGPVLPTPLLRRAALVHLRQRPWLAGLTIAGVALAVAVVIGIDLANQSAQRAFEQSIDDISGSSTHEIVGGPSGLPQSTYAQLRRSGLSGARQSAPVISGRGAVIGDRPELPERQPAEIEASTTGPRLDLLGVDPWADARIRGLTSDLMATGLHTEGSALNAFLTEPGTVALSTDLAAELGLSLGDDFLFSPTGRDANAPDRRLRVIALIEPSNDQERRAWRRLLVTDIASAQEILDRGDRLDRIDLALDDSAAADTLGTWLPPGLELRTKAAQRDALDQMTRAFRLNLTALSLLALLVGMFLIYNAMTFLVVERRVLLGRFRAMGVERRHLLTLVLFEALVLAVIGCIIGTVVGQVLARGLLGLVTQTVNDLYFAISIRELATPTWSLAKGWLLGLGGSLLAAAAPAIEASRVAPSLVSRRSTHERQARRLAPRLALVGMLLLLVSVALVLIPSRSLILGFLSILFLALGFAALIPMATWLASRLLAKPAGWLFGPLGIMATRDVGASLSRTGIATAALTIAVATTLGIAVMVGSFRATLVDWLEVTLQADLYISPARQDSRGAGPPIEPDVLDILRSHPDVAHAATYRRVEVLAELAPEKANGSARRIPTRRIPTQLHALGAERAAFEVFSLKGPADRDAVYRRFRGGEGVLVSEPYAYRHHLSAGDTMVLMSDRGPQEAEVLAIFFDFATDRGLAMIDRGLYDRWWDDRAIQSVGLYLEDGVDADRVAGELEASTGDADLIIFANREIKKLSLEIFDRTFRITEVLRWLAVAVAFLGVLSALMALQLERTRELAVFRAMGMEPRQLRFLVLFHNAILGLVAGVMAAPLGLALATMLVQVINKRSFGWTLRMVFDGGAVVEGVLLAMGAAVLAGWWPARKLGAISPASALREGR